MARRESSPRRRRRSTEETETTSTPKRASQGWGAVAKRQAIVAEAKERSDNAVRDFWMKSGESAIVQFMQDEPYCYDAHNVRDNKGNWKTIPCQLNTKKHCVLCSSGLKQTWKAAFLVLDYRGTWNGDKKAFNHDDQIPKLWTVGATVAQQLKQQIDKRGKDLTELVFEVSRSGEKKDTVYNFEPAFDEDDDEKLKPISFDISELPTAEDLCQPPTEDEIDDMGIVTD